MSRSSSSSSDSSCSEKSVGSLPDYDHLKDQQLPVAKLSLLEWMNHPEHPISQDTVRYLRQEIKSAKKNDPKKIDGDVKELRKEVKSLLKEFKESKRAQRTSRRQARRERRAKKRAEKRERRAAKKEQRQARKDARKGKNKEEGKIFPPWMTSKYPVQTPSEIPPIPEMGDEFGLAGGPPGPPDKSSMHGGFPFTQGLPYAPGRSSLPHYTELTTPVSNSAQQIHLQARQIHMQALQMMAEANTKEAKANQIRAQSTARDLDEKKRLKAEDEAAQLNEEADKLWREADRLKAEALHLDEELAKELDEENEGGQVSGVTHY